MKYLENENILSAWQGCSVTGASQGIGFAIANGLNVAGASVFGFGRSEKVKESQKYILSIFNDIRKNKEFQTPNRIFDSAGSIDILNAAGITATNDPANSFDTFSNILM